MDEPSPQIDPRFSLANERTLLAWVRTALAMLAAGGGVYEFTDISGRRGLAVGLAGMGIAAAMAGARRFAATERAIRESRELSSSRSAEVLALAVAALGLALVLSLLGS